jgi:KDO2-lipid IV(A) lauroyltransferase
VPRPVTFQHRIEYAAVRTLQAAICAMPAGMARETGALLGSAAYGLGIRKKVVHAQLRQVFGSELPDAEVERIARESYRNFGRTTFEYGRFPRLDARTVKRLISVRGGEHLRAALDQGNGALLVAGHFGNWELAATLATLGYPLTILVGEQHNSLVDGLMNRLRERFGVRLVPMTGNLMGVFRALRNNRIVAMLSDQDAGKSGIFVDFLGRQASTPYGTGRLAARTGAPLLPGVAMRQEGGRHELVICPPIEPPPADVSPEEAASVYTQGYTDVFAQFIREHPEHYFWMHRRWKTRPPGELT